MAFGLLILGLVTATGTLGEPPQWVRIVSATVSVVFVGIFALFGTSSYFSPWRFLWRRIPNLNHWIYPDLNGIWSGKTESNWSIIEALRSNAEKDGGFDLKNLEKVPLKPGRIVMEIRASLFNVSVRSMVDATGGTSRTITVRPKKNLDTGEVILYYVYQQGTPEPAGTDEATHTGAAFLEVKLGSPPIMEGCYWTLRSWRQGMNTAGLIKVSRVEERHVASGSDLLGYGAETV